ncbi:unnamed protein product [Absidia cylindrospora]
MASSILLKKQEELNARLVPDLLRLPENKKCFDCPTKSPFFVNVTLQTFICSRCSGLVREVGHCVKSISASKFTGPELTALEHGGNGIATKIWLSCGYNAVDTPEPESNGEVRAFMRQKYYEKKWLNCDLAVSHDLFVRDRINELFTEEGLPKQQRQQRQRQSTIENNSNGSPMTFDLTQHQRLKNVPSPLNLSSTNKVHQPTIQTAPLMMNSLQPQPKLCSPKLHKDHASKSSSSSPSLSASVPVSPAPTVSSNASSTPQPTTPMDSIFSDLAGLTLTGRPPTQSSPSYPGVTTTATSNRRATYTGGILTPSSKINTNSKDSSSKRASIQPTTTFSAPRVVPSVEDPSFMSNHKRTTSLQSNDPYSALRAHHDQQQLQHQQMVSAIMATSQSSSALHNRTMKKQDTDNDPYAALRQLSGDSHDIFNNTLAILPSTSSTWSPPPPQKQQLPSSSTWSSPPTPQPQQVATSLNSESHHVPLWQGKKKKNITHSATMFECHTHLFHSSLMYRQVVCSNDRRMGRG